MYETIFDLQKRLGDYWQGGGRYIHAGRDEPDHEDIAPVGQDQDRLPKLV
jgi:hypothetical protein